MYVWTSVKCIPSTHNSGLGKKNISVFAARYHHSPIGSKTKTKKKKIKGSTKITTNAATQSGPSDTFDLRDENFIVEED